MADSLQLQTTEATVTTEQLTTSYVSETFTRTVTTERTPDPQVVTSYVTPVGQHVSSCSQARHRTHHHFGTDVVTATMESC